MNIIKHVLINLLAFSLGFFICKHNFKDTIYITNVKEIKDSIFIIHDSIQEKIVYINKEYNEKVDTVLTANDSLLLDMFTKYIENYK